MRRINSLEIKIIALLTMLIDHIGYCFFPELIFLRIIGRLAFPLFVFMTVEGFLHTKNLPKYIANLLLCACVSEVFFDYIFYGTLTFAHTNSVFTLAAGVICMYAISKDIMMGMTFSFLIGLLLRLVGFEYGLFGIVIAVGLYCIQKYFKRNLIYMMSGYIALTMFMIFYSRSIEAYSSFALILIVLYDGRKGYSSKWIKRLFYWFYPVHLALLFTIQTVLQYS